MSLIRFYERHAKWLVMLLADLRKEEPNVLEQLFRVRQNEHRALNRQREEADQPVPPTQLEMIEQQLFDEHYDGLPDPTLDDLLGPLLAQLGGTQPNDALLIEKVVQILQLDQDRNIVGGRTLQALRKAILTAEEMRGLEERLTANVKVCGQCGRDLCSGEMMTVFMEAMGGGQWRNNFHCVKCRKPSFVPCSVEGCEHVVSTGQTWERGKLYRCEEHQADKTAPKREDEDGVITLNRMNELNEAFVQWGRELNIPPATPPARPARRRDR